MKMVRDTIIMSEEMNPRGGQAKPLEATAKRAAWLSVMCGYWLAYNDDDQRIARANETTYNLPKEFIGADRIHKARKLCDEYTPAARVEGGLLPSLTSATPGVPWGSGALETCGTGSTRSASSRPR